ncbi:hypothetical protein Tco_0320468 [Tanacetum coccineum]
MVFADKSWLEKPRGSRECIDKTHVRYVVQSRDERRTTQNSGICAPGPDGEMSYGQLQEILEFKYLSFKVALFRVKWFDTRNNVDDVLEHMDGGGGEDPSVHSYIIRCASCFIYDKMTVGTQEEPSEIDSSLSYAHPLRVLPRYCGSLDKQGCRFHDELDEEQQQVSYEEEDKKVREEYAKCEDKISVEETTIWMTFEGNTQRRDGVAIPKRRRQDFQGEDVSDLAAVSERSRLKEDLEYST